VPATKVREGRVSRGAIAVIRKALPTEASGLKKVGGQKGRLRRIRWKKTVKYKQGGRQTRKSLIHASALKCCLATAWETEWRRRAPDIRTRLDFTRKRSKGEKEWEES